MEEWNVPGAAIAVSRERKILYARGLGQRDLQKRASVTPDTVFGIASVTKSFTAMAVMQLYHEGRLSLSDPIRTYLKDYGWPRGEGAEITLHHLLSHTSGFPPVLWRPDLPGFPDHAHRLTSGDHTILGAPGEYFSYSNDLFLLLGAVIEEVSNKPYLDYMQDHILTPLGLERTTFCWEKAAAWSNVSKFYVREEGEVCEKLYPEIGRYDVGGGILSTVTDLIRYGAAYLDQSPTGIIPPGSVLAKMWQPVYQIEATRHYGYGLHVTSDYHYGTLVEHGGSLVGVSAHFGFVPEQRLVAAVLINITGVPAERLFSGAINTAMGLPLDYGSHEQPPTPHEPLRQEIYAGRYSSQEEITVDILAGDHGLVLKEGEETFPLLGGTDGFFAYRCQGAMRQVRFYQRPGEEEAWGLLYAKRMLRREKRG